MDIFDQELSVRQPVIVLLDFDALPVGANTEELPIVLPHSASPALVRLVGHLNCSYSVRGRWSGNLLLKRTDRSGDIASR